MADPRESVEIACRINGRDYRGTVPVRQHLADFLRERLGLTGTHLGCEHGACGACSVKLDGDIVRGCLVLAAQADGCDIETIEGAVESGRLKTLAAAFHERNAGQCGFCSPGMLLVAAELLERNPRPSRTEIRAHISGNYCRCTGYQAIVDAIEQAAAGPRPAKGEAS